MSGETPFTIVGNLTADPELKFTTGGVAMARFTIASTPRTFDKTTNQWVDGTAMFIRCTAWRDMANYIAETLARGMRVIATGNLVQNNWKTPEGENRSMLGLDVQDIGPSLRFATAKVTRAQRTSAPASGGPATDSWSTPAPAVAGAAAGNWGGDGPVDPPF
ncbi:single-stranded DNA-binding protein [Kitasatospora sp. NPDC006697]|uniref:single-stranded DNA-binding protein n=1 Tax=Kitasatospora sp. NPDC006697 TaxID=3364020 RepID=UPI0036B91D9D